MVDEDWWMGENERHETGLFPSNYVELIEGEPEHEEAPSAPARAQQHQEVPMMHEPVGVSVPPAGPARGKAGNPTATALFDYEAAEDNELSL